MKPVFIHISKNAGTSIIASAGDHIVTAGHQIAAKWVAEHGRASPLFAVIRNPYDRVISEYVYRKRRHAAGERNPHLANLDKTFGDWVVSTFREGEFRTRAFFERTGIPFNPANMINDTLIWFISQKCWLDGDNGEILADHILRYETLEDDWARFMAKYNFSARLEHRNASPRLADPGAYYTAQTRELVFEYFRTDFNVFGYAK